MKLRRAHACEGRVSARGVGRSSVYSSDLSVYFLELEENFARDGKSRCWGPSACLLKFRQKLCFGFWTTEDIPGRRGRDKKRGDLLF